MICDLQVESEEEGKHVLILSHKALARICDSRPETGIWPLLGELLSIVGLPVFVPLPEHADNTDKKIRQTSVFIYFLFGETTEKLENYIDRFDLGSDLRLK